MTDETAEAPIPRLPAEITAHNEEDVEAVASAMYDVTFPDAEPNQWLLDSDDVRDLFRDRARALLDQGVVVSTGQVRRLSQAVRDHMDYPLDDFDDLYNRMLAASADHILELIPEHR